MADISENLAKARGFVRERGLGFGLELLVNFILPFLIYDFGKARLGDVHALMASSAPPIAWSLFEFARRRRVDALSILVLSGIALSLLAYLGGGSVRFLQLREKMITALIGLVFLGSAAIGKPLIYQLARATIQRRSPSELESFEALRDNVFFRRTMMLMTLVWGFALVAEAAVACLLVVSLSVRDYLLVGPVVGYGTMGSLSLWTFWYSRRQRRRGEARRAAAEALARASEVAPPA
jgi:intracellular septation protein A